MTLVLEPPRERPTLPPGSVAVDIVTLGYSVVVERASGVFDHLRQEMRGALGLEGVTGGAPDPAKAADPSLLWPALGLAFEPARFVPAAVLLLAALSLRWIPGVTARLGALGAPVLAAVAAALAAALATTGTAAATHEMITEGGRLSVRDAARALLRRPALFMGAARDAGLRAAMAALLAATVSLLAGLEPSGGVAAAIARASAPAQALLVVGALALVVAAVHRLIAYAALAPQARGLLMVQASLEMKRISGERELAPTRTLAPALAAAVVLGVALAGAARLVIGTWDTVAGANPLSPLARTMGRDVVAALAGGVWCSYLGIVGLMAGYALGTGISHEPVRAPDIITGTWGAGPRPPMKPIRDDRPREESRPDPDE